MAYQNVWIPRFYIDQIQYLRSLGFDFEKFYTDHIPHQGLGLKIIIKL